MTTADKVLHDNFWLDDSEICNFSFLLDFDKAKLALKDGLIEKLPKEVPFVMAPYARQVYLEAVSDITAIIEEWFK